MSRQIETVAIIGGGPSGSTLACRLAMRGVPRVPARARLERIGEDGLRLTAT